MPFDGVNVSEVTERLIIGRARIEAGWCQGNFHLSRRTWWRGWRHEYCLIGAAGGPEDAPKGLVIDLLTMAIADLGYGPMTIAAFNDSPGRTKDQVLDVLDLAIAMSRGKASTAFSGGTQ